MHNQIESFCKKKCLDNKNIYCSYRIIKCLKLTSKSNKLGKLLNSLLLYNILINWLAMK